MTPFGPEHLAAVAVAVVAAGVIVRGCLRRHRKFEEVRRAVAERRANDRADHVAIRLRPDPPVSRLPNIDSTYENDDWIHLKPAPAPDPPAPATSAPGDSSLPADAPAVPEHRARWQDRRPTWRELTRDGK